MHTDIQESALLDALLQATVDAIIVADDTGTILRTNPAACRLFQYDADELINQNVKILMPAPLSLTDRRT